MYVLENLSGIFGFRSELGKWPYVQYSGFVSLLEYVWIFPFLTVMIL